jgi:hypothetical protein
MFDVLLLAVALQVQSAELRVTATVVNSCRISVPVSGIQNGPLVGCSPKPQPQLRIYPGATQYGPVFVIDF